MSAAAEVEAFFGGAIAWALAGHGGHTARGRAHRAAGEARRRGGRHLVAQNAAVETVSTERSHYIVRLGGRRPRVCVAVGVRSGGAVSRR